MKENNCCPKCNFKRTVHDSANLVYFSEEYCGNVACECHLKQAERKIDEALLFSEGEY